MTYQREVTGLTIDLLKRDNRQLRPAMDIAARTKRALERGEKLLAEARLARKLSQRT